MTTLKRFLPNVEDGLVFGGLALVSLGAGMVFLPSAPMVLGAGLFWLGVRKD